MRQKNAFTNMHVHDKSKRILLGTLMHVSMYVISQGEIHIALINAITSLAHCVGN